ncbi:hypothetical protein [Heyndrickxia shackletonii]|uniref:hypothetical protein n=1 Tax=Heyndrickxia shackletonii TaxID=157838 RepID=UPI00128EB019|nr:hypothetical protein [Heyndrickxia shackletonii]NEZ00618.1 hypothetical protein [Heyndrickxia shackletonii]
MTKENIEVVQKLVKLTLQISLDALTHSKEKSACQRLLAARHRHLLKTVIRHFSKSKKNAFIMKALTSF